MLPRGIQVLLPEPGLPSPGASATLLIMSRFGTLQPGKAGCMLLAVADVIAC
jgi:hypothetical protein